MALAAATDLAMNGGPTLIRLSFRLLLTERSVIIS